MAMMVRSRATRKRARKLHNIVSQKRTLLGWNSTSSSVRSGPNPEGCGEGDGFSTSTASAWPLVRPTWPGWPLPRESRGCGSAAMTGRGSPGRAATAPLCGGLRICSAASNRENESKAGIEIETR